MRPLVTVITVGVDDLERAVAFYRDGLALPTEGIVGAGFEQGAVAFFDLQPGLKLAVWPRADIAHDAGLGVDPKSRIEFTLGHNVRSRDDVDATIAGLRPSRDEAYHLRPKDKEGAMPELLIDFITSLDGYAAADGWPGWWGLQGPEYLAWLGRQPEADYTVLMGATTYRLMSRFAAEGESGTDALAATSKVVFSTTLREPLSWANTQLVADDPVAAVRQMKDAGSTSMRTLGSLTLCRALLKASLVDRFRVVVFPVITGRTGRERIYGGYPDVALDMISSRTFDGRIQLLEYVPTVLPAPPGTNGASA